MNGRLTAFLGVALLTALGSGAAFAGGPTRVWSGAVDGNWSNGANWVGGVAPVTNETYATYQFPAVASLTGNKVQAMNNDVTGLQPYQVDFQDTGYSLTGNGITTQGSIDVSGGTASGSVDVGVPVALGFNGSFPVANDLNLVFQQPISGSWPVTTSSTGGAGGAVHFAAANTYTGTTTVSSGYLYVENAQGLGSADGTAATGTVVASGATIVLSGTIANEALTVGGDGANGNAAIQTSGPSTWTGPITLSANTTASGLTGPLTLAGAIGDGGAGYGFDFRSSVVLTGSNTYTGQDQMEYGDVSVDGSNTASFRTDYGGLSGGTLRGTGTVAGISAGGAGATNNVVAPGSASAVGTLTSSAAVTLDANTTFQARIGGPTDGIDSDQLFVTAGGTTLANAPVLSLSVINAYSVPIGNSYTLIDNSETGATTGTFAGLPENGVITANGQAFRISYAGGPLSNNVVVTRIAATPVGLQEFRAE